MTLCPASYMDLNVGPRAYEAGTFMRELASQPACLIASCGRVTAATAKARWLSPSYLSSESLSATLLLELAWDSGGDPARYT